MSAKKPVSSVVSKTDLRRIDAHVITPEEYEEIPELTDEMLSRARLYKGGRPVSPNPRTLVSLRIPADVLARWRATGAGWQTRMVERLSSPLPRRPRS